MRSSRLDRLWSSATLMTWLNISARVLSFAFVLPLVLRQFAPGDIALYYLFASMIALQLMAGSGFVPTFSRFVSYALAGATEEDFERLRTGARGGAIQRPVDPVVTARIVATLNRVFGVLSLATIPVVVIVGTWLLAKPVALASSPREAWLAWGIVVAITPLTLYSAKFSALLQGANRVAQEQRWSAVFVIAGALGGGLVLLAGGGLLALVAVNQLAQVFSFVRLWWLANATLKEIPYDSGSAAYSPRIFRAVWPSSWKSFVGVAASGGITSLSGLIFAQRLPSIQLAEFLLALRVMAIVGEMTRAPFYSKLPVLNRLRAENDLPGLILAARRGMRLGYVAYVGFFLVTPVAAAFVLPLIKSNIVFPDVAFWCLLGAAVLIERLGAMHVQVYSTTNHIIWHWLNGVTGVLWIGLMLLLVPDVGYWAYPIAMFTAYACFYTLIGVRRSLKSIDSAFWRFERLCFVPAAGAFMACAGLLLALRPLLLRQAA